MEYEPQANAAQLVSHYPPEFVGTRRGVFESICYSEPASVWRSHPNPHTRARIFYHRGAGIFRSGKVDPCDRFLQSSPCLKSCWEADLRQPIALIIGGEADGAGESARKLASQKISIPMPGKIESLNAGVAGSILMFEVVRQRSNL